MAFILWFGKRTKLQTAYDAERTAAFQSEERVGRMRRCGQT
jgi:hypothetical protein